MWTQFPHNSKYLQFPQRKSCNPPLGSVEIVKSALVFLQRAAERGASRVVVLVAVVRLPLPLPRLCSH